MRTFLVVCTLLVSFVASANDSVRVTGTGRTEREAIQAGFREAIEIVSGSVILTDLESNNNRLQKNAIADYSAGYIDNYKIISSDKEGRLYKVIMDVTVRPSKMAEHKLISAQDTSDIDGNRIGTAYRSYLNERDSADNLIKKLLGDYPKNAFSVVQGKPAINVDHRRFAIISVPVEIRWSEKYFASLKEAFSVVQDKPQYFDIYCQCYMARERISILTKKPNTFFYDEDIFYLKDNAIAGMVRVNLSQPPKILATIFDPNNNPIFNQCFHLEQHFVEVKARNLFQIRGFINVSTVVDIEIPPRGKLSEQLSNAGKIELSLVKNCS